MKEAPFWHIVFNIKEYEAWNVPFTLHVVLSGTLFAGRGGLTRFSSFINTMKCLFHCCMGIQMCVHFCSSRSFRHITSYHKPFKHIHIYMYISIQCDAKMNIFNAGSEHVINVGTSRVDLQWQKAASLTRYVYT